MLVIPVVVTIVAIASAKLSALQSLGATIAGVRWRILVAQLARDAGKKGEKALYARWGRDAIRSDLPSPGQAVGRNHKSAVPQETLEPGEGREGAIFGGRAGRPDRRGRDVCRVVELSAGEYARHKEIPARLPGTRQLRIPAQRVGATTNRHHHERALLRDRGDMVVPALPQDRHNQRGNRAACGLALVFLLLWLLRFSTDWVRIPADAYAERLAETVDALGSASKATTK